eukprot:TRINITY_DN2664_c0_g1_i6.p1 TRINITY_DN2664_c0_g1~~TRINITY_DN2664_c0_g1_i6.p1  ORF type:complete len:152 (-),score=30.51 TRINITY_DN2664_c0_g1_i6:503-895(-)
MCIRDSMGIGYYLCNILGKNAIDMSKPRFLNKFVPKDNKEVIAPPKPQADSLMVNPSSVRVEAAINTSKPADPDKSLDEKIEEIVGVLGSHFERLSIKEALLKSDSDKSKTIMLLLDQQSTFHVHPTVRT